MIWRTIVSYSAQTAHAFDGSTSLCGRYAAAAAREEKRGDWHCRACVAVQVRREQERRARQGTLPLDGRKGFV